MGYTNSRATIKWWYPLTKKLKKSSADFDAHNNKIDKVWSSGSKLILGTNTSTPLTLKLTPHIIPAPNMIYFNVI